MDARTFQLVSQQRKARKHIIGTSQVFGRLAKPFREQFKYAVACEQLFGHIQRQQIFRAVDAAYEDDIKTELKSVGVKYYFRAPTMYGLYDTREIVRRVRNDGFERS